MCNGRSIDRKIKKSLSLRLFEINAICSKTAIYIYYFFWGGGGGGTCFSFLLIHTYDKFKCVILESLLSNA